MSSFDQRIYGRYDITETIDFTLNPFDVKTYKGEIFNISQTGLCIFSPIVLEKGQEIHIKDEIPAPSQNAVVVWIEEEKGTARFRVGLEFIHV